MPSPTSRSGESHRVASVSERAGGKGLNVAAVLTSMGSRAVAVAPVGEMDLDLFASDLGARRVPHRLVPSPCPTRRSVAVVEASGRVTLLNEPGIGQSQRVWDRIADEIAALAPGRVDADGVGQLSAGHRPRPRPAADPAGPRVRSARSSSTSAASTCRARSACGPTSSSPTASRPHRP